LGFA
jgi:thioredoxin reductase